MIIVVTGGAGFLGSHLCEFLLKLGHRVICIDNFITGTRENISHLLTNTDFKLIEQDVSKYIDIDGKLDWVLHFASPASPIDYQRYPIQTLKAGALGTHNTLGLAKSKGAKFLLASTSEVYGDPSCNPQPETYWGSVNPIGPRGVYDEAKRFAEAITMAYHRYHGVNCRIARIFNTYGERMRLNDGRVIPNFISQSLKGDNLTIYGDGTQTRSFCYVADMIDGIWRLMNTEIHEPVNLGNPVEFTVIELAKLFIKITGSKSKIVYLPLPEDDPKVRCPDIRLAKAKLGWLPKVSLEEGLKKAINYFKQSPY
ncbi:MAG: SDR family oxidoreductase [bacterium]|nr:SDR family oxidoreductase [bacterium]